MKYIYTGFVVMSLPGIFYFSIIQHRLIRVEPGLGVGSRKRVL